MTHENYHYEVLRPWAEIDHRESWTLRVFLTADRLRVLMEQAT